MKRMFVVAVLLLVAVSAFAQVTNRVVLPNFVIPAYNFKTYATYTATSDDTTGNITIDGVGQNILLGSEVVLYAVADTCAADVYIIPSNSQISGEEGTAYADSVVTTSLDNSWQVIVIKSPTVNRFPGFTSIKVGTVFRGAGQDVSAGRTFKWYLMWKP
jgi:hypothetical protein